MCGVGTKRKVEGGGCGVVRGVEEKKKRASLNSPLCGKESVCPSLPTRTVPPGLLSVEPRLGLAAAHLDYHRASRAGGRGQVKVSEAPTVAVSVTGSGRGRDGGGACRPVSAGPGLVQSVSVRDSSSEAWDEECCVSSSRLSAPHLGSVLICFNVKRVVNGS